MLYFDEAGYTGPDLTNAAQPFFTLASSRINDIEAEELKNDIGYEKWGKELHFKNMYSNPQGRAILDRLFKHPLLNDKRIKLAFANKRYCIYAQIVNTLVETFYHNQGKNIYKGAYNLLLANLMYSGAILHENQKLVSEFESNFIKMVRNPSVESVANFYRTTDCLIANNGSSAMLQCVLSEIPKTITCIKEALSVQSFYLDLTIPLFVDSVEKWYSETSIKDDIVFDSSEPFFANIDLLKSMRDMEVEDTMVGYGERKHLFPLPIGKMETGTSHDHFGIQIADVYASALCFILTPRSDKFVQYQERLRDLPIFRTVEINIAPSTTEYLEKRMKDIDGIDSLDFICEHISPS